jgi:intracellular multiplication protein IcmS
LGVSFERSRSSMIGITFTLDDKVPASLRLLCVTDVLIEIVQNAKSSKTVALDELMLD